VIPINWWNIWLYVWSIQVKIVLQKMLNFSLMKALTTTQYTFCNILRFSKSIQNIGHRISWDSKSFNSLSIYIFVAWSWSETESLMDPNATRQTDINYCKHGFYSTMTSWERPVTLLKEFCFVKVIYTWHLTKDYLLHLKSSWSYAVNKRHLKKTCYCVLAWVVFQHITGLANFYKQL